MKNLLLSKAFDTINIHKLIRKLLQTNNPGTVIKFIANYIKGRKANTRYRNQTSSQRQFKTGVPQGAVLSLTLFNIYTADTPPPSAPVQVMAYPDGITIIPTHTSTSAAKKYIQPYLHKVFVWTKQNNLTLNPDKTTCTLFSPDPAEYNRNMYLKINNIALPMATHGSGFYLRSKTHIHHTHSQHLSTSTQATTYDKSTVMRPALEYASFIWSPLLSSTSINKLQVMQNAALRTATGRTQDTNIQHLLDETLIFPIREYLQLHASQYKQETQHPSHLLHKHTTYVNTPRLKNTIFNNGRYTTTSHRPHTVTTTDIKTNMRHIHTSIVYMNLDTRGNNKILRTPPPHIKSSNRYFPASLVASLSNSEQINHPSSNHRHKVDAKTHLSPRCPRCNTHTHHLFNCNHIRTTLSPLDVWTDPTGVTALLARWTEKLAGGPQARRSDSPASNGHGSG